jgi:hypothetical protein
VSNSNPFTPPGIVANRWGVKRENLITQLLESGRVSGFALSDAEFAFFLWTKPFAESKISIMVKTITSLFLIATMVGAPISTSEAQAGPARFSFSKFQQQLNAIFRTRKGVAAQNGIIAAYARFARFNPNQAFALVRMATVQLNRVTPPAQRAAGIVRLSQATSSAFIATGTNDTSLIISTFTYLVSSIPPESREPSVIQTIAQDAVQASVDTGGTPQESVEIVQAIGGSTTGVIPTS